MGTGLFWSGSVLKNADFGIFSPRESRMRQEKKYNWINIVRAYANILVNIFSEAR